MSSPPGPATGQPAAQERVPELAVPSDPGAMRQAMADYVAALHTAYLSAAMLLPPLERAHLPLLSGRDVTVIAIGARHLHLLATTERMPAPIAPEVELVGTLTGLTWTLRFLDPVVLPELGLVDESTGPNASEVRRVIGVSDVVYHLSVSPGGGLTPHHASHAGTALANQHGAAYREVEVLRRGAVGHEAQVDELAVATRLGLHHAVRALAALIAPADPQVAAACTDPAVDDDGVRRALLHAYAPVGAR